MVLIFFIGTAGSGKSFLTASFNEWCKIEKQKVSTVNLDPGVLNLPYVPDIDIRNYVDVHNIMKEYGLGPNGALILAADLIAEEAASLGGEIQDHQSDIVIVDTPGQMELFAFRASGLYIANELTKDPKAIVYLFDAVFSHDPLNYVSNMFLSAAVYNRFFFPQLHLLSKCDLLPTETINHIVKWSSNAIALEMDIEEKLSGTRRLLSRDIMQAIYGLGLQFELLPVSGKNNHGMLEFNSALQRIFVQGEEFTS